MRIVLVLLPGKETPTTVPVSTRCCSLYLWIQMQAMTIYLWW